MAMYTLSVCVCMYFASDQHDNIVSGMDGNLYNNTRIYVQESTSLFAPRARVLHVRQIGNKVRAINAVTREIDDLDTSVL